MNMQSSRRSIRTLILPRRRNSCSRGNGHRFKCPRSTSLLAGANACRLGSLCEGSPRSLKLRCDHWHCPHLMLEFFRVRTGTNIQFIPYKGAAPAIADVLGGQIQLHVSTKAVLLPLIKAGRLRALAVSSVERWPELPDVPTLRESGLDGYPPDIWFGLMAPKGTPEWGHRQTQYRGECSADDSRIAGCDQKLGMQPRAMNANEFETVLRHEVQLWGAVARETGIQLD